jgi:Flp pilus assembly secretin CpaC
MRRILVSVFAAVASLTVLASNFVPVSAPTSTGEVDIRHLSASDAARLSDLRVATLVVTPQFAPVVSDAVAVQPDLEAFEPHAAAAPEAFNAPKPIAEITGLSPSFLTAWAQIPATIFEKVKLVAMPEPVVESDVLAASAVSHQASGQTELSAERDSIAFADSAKYEAPVLPHFVTAALAAPFANIERPQLAEQPAAPAGIDALSTVAEHVSFPAVTFSLDRVSAEPEVANAPAPIVPMFITAAFQVPETIFQRARFVDEPSAPVVAEILHATGRTHAPDFAVAETVSNRVAADADVPVEKALLLPTFVTAIAEIPSAIFNRQRIVASPDAPAPVEVLAANSIHMSASADAVPATRVSETMVADAASYRAPLVPSFVSAITDAPSAIFQKMGLLSVPEAPVSTEPLTVNAEHIALNEMNAGTAERSVMLPDAFTAPMPQPPVLISNQTAMSANNLKPMGAGPLVDAPLLNENAIASSNNSTTPFDRMIATPDVPEAILKAQPVLISGRSSFSTDLLKPMNAVPNPFVKISNDEILAAVQRFEGYCDPNWVGQPIRFTQTVELKLEDLINQLHQRFGVNFILGKNVAGLPLNVKAGNIPWNTLLRSQLFISGVRARCIDANTIELVENATLGSLQDYADVEARFVKLKFLQRTSNSAVGLSGQSQSSQGGGQSGCGSSGGGQSGGGGGGGSGGGQSGETAAQLGSSKFDKLIIEIEKILGLRSMQESTLGSGSQGGQGGQAGTQQQGSEVIRSNRYVTQVPGRNILAIRATKEEHELINQIIVRADRPPFQVVIKGLVYTANQDRLLDVGVQTSITEGLNPDGTVRPGQTTSGGVLGNTLGVGTLFDFSTVLGTIDFNIQATAFQQNGVISVKSRPFATVVDGLCTTLDVGRSLLIPIDGGIGGQGGLEEIKATNTLAVAPYVIDDENGNPVAVTLDLTLTANELDTSVSTRGVPAVAERSISTQLMLQEDKTAILGGFTLDSDSRSVTKTPGLGDIPIIGELFKRRIRDKRVNRLYFAISVDVITYPEMIRPVDVPGATTDPPSITPEQKKRADNAEPKQVNGP